MRPIPHSMVVSTFVALVALVASNANAASPGTCEAWVQFMAATLDTNKTMSCALTGDRYSPDLAAQKRWCIQSTEEAVTNVQAKINGALYMCKTCRPYADKFNDQMATNIQYSCGLTGRLWPMGTDQYQECFHRLATDPSQDTFRALYGNGGVRDE